MSTMPHTPPSAPNDTPAIPAPLLIGVVALAIGLIVTFCIPLLIETIAPSIPLDKSLYDRFLHCTGPNACLDR
jgi:hypothetical protein